MNPQLEDDLALRAESNALLSNLLPTVLLKSQAFPRFFTVAVDMNDNAVTQHYYVDVQ